MINKQAVLEMWQRDAKAVHKSEAEAGTSPHEVALKHAEAIRVGVAAGLKYFALDTENPIELAEALEAGEFDHEIAAILGYI